MTTTSIEQSKHLLELGLKPETADMLWVEDFDHNYDIEIRFNVIESYNPNNLKMIPAWSLEGLLKVIPKNPKFKCALREREENKIVWCFWCHEISLYEFEGKSDFECIYKMVCWLFENGYIKKEE